MLGDSLRNARRVKQFSQARLAEAAGINIATLQGLERGRGTMGSLTRVLTVLDQKFVDQPSDFDLGGWLAARRKSAGLRVRLIMFSRQFRGLRVVVS